MPTCPKCKGTGIVKPEIKIVLAGNRKSFSVKVENYIETGMTSEEIRKTGIDFSRFLHSNTSSGFWNAFSEETARLNRGVIDYDMQDYDQQP